MRIKWPEHNRTCSQETLLASPLSSFCGPIKLSSTQGAPKRLRSWDSGNWHLHLWRTQSPELSKPASLTTPFASLNMQLPGYWSARNFWHCWAFSVNDTWAERKKKSGKHTRIDGWDPNMAKLAFGDSIALQNLRTLGLSAHSTPMRTQGQLHICASETVTT